MSNGNVPRGEVNTPNLNRTYPHPTSCLSWAVFKDWIKRPQTLTHCFILKALDTFGNCQRPVFLLGVPQHMHKITNLRKIWLNWSLNLQGNNERRKKHLLHYFVCFQIVIKRLQLKSFLLFELEITSFSKTA